MSILQEQLNKRTVELHLIFTQTGKVQGSFFVYQEISVTACNREGRRDN